VEKVSLELRAKLHFVLGEQRKVLRYHKAKVRQPLEARISRLGGTLFHAFI